MHPRGFSVFHSMFIDGLVKRSTNMITDSATVRACLALLDILDQSRCREFTLLPPDFLFMHVCMNKNQIKTTKAILPFAMRSTPARGPFRRTHRSSPTFASRSALDNLDASARDGRVQVGEDKRGARLAVAARLRRCRVFPVAHGVTRCIPSRIRLHRRMFVGTHVLVRDRTQAEGVGCRVQITGLGLRVSWLTASHEQQSTSAYG